MLCRCKKVCPLISTSHCTGSKHQHSSTINLVPYTEKISVPACRPNKRTLRKRNFSWTTSVIGETQELKNLPFRKHRQQTMKNKI